MAELRRAIDGVRLADVRVIVVEAEEVELLRGSFQKRAVFFADLGHEALRAVIRFARFRIVTVAVDVEPPVIFKLVVVLARHDIRRVAVERIARPVREAHADLAVRHDVVEREHRLCVAEVHVVIRLQPELLLVEFPGRVPRRDVAELRENVLLVDRDPMLHAIAEALEHEFRVRGEIVGALPALPATVAVLERLRQIPVVERDHRRDAVLQAFIDDVIVKLDAFFIRLAAALGQHARPRDGKAVRLQPHLAHERDVFLVAVVVVDGDVAVRPLERLAGDPDEFVPDAPALAVLVVGALDLVRSRRRAPEETVLHADTIHGHATFLAENVNAYASAVAAPWRPCRSMRICSSMRSYLR